MFAGAHDADPRNPWRIVLTLPRMRRACRRPGQHRL